MSALRTFLQRGRKAIGMPPAQLARRVGEELSRRTRRPWDRVRAARFTERALLRATGAASIDELWSTRMRAPFFLGDRAATARAFRERYPDALAAVVHAADRALAHEFDLLGSGPVTLPARLPWRTDFKTGREWPRQYCRSIEYAELDRPTDVKVPWELSRCQHFTMLGEAFWLTDDERYAREYVDQVTDWLADNPFAYSVNWSCAMDVALRAISWIWGFHFFAAARPCADATFRSRLLRALYLHGEFVHANIERSDLNGNHYLTDGVGLVFLGAFFHDTAAGRCWLETGRGIVVDEIGNQVSEDGVDFEQSTAYHRLVLEGFLAAYLLLDRAGVRVPRPALDRLAAMCDYVAAYTKPDGRAPLVGDADDGRMQQLGRQPLNDHRYLLSTAAVLFERADFKAAAGRFWEESFWLLGPALRAFDTIAAPASDQSSSSSRAFPAGGFYVLRTPRTHVFVDCSEVGMRGRGGHGHNDVLSFELVLDGLDVITDCGAFVYTASREWRNRFRSTAFHNVVQVDDEELNRFVSPAHLWTLHDDARPADVVWRSGDDLDYFAGRHTGYERLTDPVRVRREIVLDRARDLVVVRDTLESAGPHRYCWRFHFDPALAVTSADDAIAVSANGRSAWLLPVAPVPLAIEDAWVSPSYGVKQPARSIGRKRAARRCGAGCSRRRR